MTLIENILVDDDIIKARFCCDLGACKGACCTFPGEFGAPVTDAEARLMEQCLPEAAPYLSERNLKYIDKYGIVEGQPGEQTTVCINNRDCVFVYFDGDVAYCALERAYFDGKIEFRKPLSCHLFPIRVRNMNGEYIFYQQISECKPGIKHGFDKNIYLYESLKDALIRAYGEEWYEVFSAYCQTQASGQRPDMNGDSL